MLERFAENECSAKLFQVSVSGSTHTALSLSAMITERKSSQIEGCKRQSENRRYSVNASIAGGSPPPTSCWHGEDPVTPLHHWQKKKTKCVCLRNGSRYQTSELALYIPPLVVCRLKLRGRCPESSHSERQSRPHSTHFQPFTKKES